MPMSRDTDHLACCLVAELAALVKDREPRAHLVAPAVQVDQAANSLDLREVQATVKALALASKIRASRSIRFATGPDTPLRF